MKIGIVTLGCDKNTVDSEYIAGALKRRGMTPIAAPHDILSDPEPPADLGAVVINTCGFIGPAKEESIGSILEWAEWRRENNGNFLLAVVGCLTQRYARQLSSEMPEIDMIAGVGQFDEVASAIAKAHKSNIKGGARAALSDSSKTSHPFFQSVRRAPTVNVESERDRVALERRQVPYGFLKIADGCNYKCAFCAIPRMKGKYRSVPRNVILHEAIGLIEDGVRELCIVAQDTPKYGRDIYRKYGIVKLLQEICALPGDFRVRLFYLYPTGLTRDLIELFKDEPRLCRYVDIPLQHLDAEMLRIMRRPSKIEEHMKWLEQLREEIPGFAIRTTFIVGHPGEKEKHFKTLLRNMERMRFDHVGVFEYSEEEEVAAAKLIGHVSEKVKSRRREEAMALQSNISLSLNEARVGEIERILIEGHDNEANLYIGRSEREAPEVDGLVIFQSSRKLETGQFVDVRITAADVYDVSGEEENLNH